MSKRRGNIIVAYREKDVKRLINYINNVESRLKTEIEDEIKPLQNKTKRIVKSNLRNNNGVRTGKYKKSIVLNNLSKEQGEVKFQVGSKKHYRLTHLLENRHRIKSHGRFVKGRTKKIPHIRPGQDYVDQELVNLYEKAIKKSFEKG